VLQATVNSLKKNENLEDNPLYQELQNMKQENQKLTEKNYVFVQVTEEMSQNIQSLNEKILTKDLLLVNEPLLENDSELRKFDSEEILKLKLELQATKDENYSYKETLEEVYRVKDRAISELNEELTNEMLKNEEEMMGLAKKHMEDLDVIKAECLTLKENGSLPKQAVFENQKNNGDSLLQTKHERIVCDCCFKCPIYGNRFKVMSEGTCYDLCDECYKKTPVNDPIIEFKSPSSLSPEKMEEIMPCLRMLFSDIYEGKCKLHFNKGFKK